MNRRNQFGTALVVLAIALLTVPAFFPIQAVLIHDTNPITLDEREQIEGEGIEIVGYENLSERGQEVYVQALENGGEYRVSQGEGAPDFTYLTNYEQAEARQENRDTRPSYIAIERPEDADLPPADEPFMGDGERAQQAQRYDLMEVSKGSPPLDSTPQLLRLAVGLLAVVSAGIGGYLLSSK